MISPPAAPGHSGALAPINLWLAFGDETGEFKDPQSSSLHGVGLILARPATLASALNEELGGRTIRRRMDSPVAGLENWLRQDPGKAEELGRHHVREAWRYLRDEKKLKGEYPLEALPDEPVLANLLCAFRWLAGHPGIVSLGIQGSGREVMGDFSRGIDGMAILGTLYGRTLALVRPFLGASPRIRMLAGRRSEEMEEPSIVRAGQYVPAPAAGRRQTTSKTGGNRTLLDAMERQFWETLARLGDQWPVPALTSARQAAFAGYMEKEALATALDREDRQAASLVRGEEKRLNNLADLACSLMAASCHSARHDLSIRFPDPIGPNVRFFSAREVMA